MAIRTNYDFIKNSIAGYSHGKQALMGLMYSFFDAEYGQQLLEKSQTPNFIQARSILDKESLEIVSHRCSSTTATMTVVLKTIALEYLNGLAINFYK